MADLRSGRCHGPGCYGVITDVSMSEDFCGQACQARWQAALVGVVADSSLTAPPSESFAAYAPRVPSLPLRLAVQPDLLEQAERAARRGAPTCASCGADWFDPSGWANHACAGPSRILNETAEVGEAATPVAPKDPQTFGDLLSEHNDIPSFPSLWTRFRRWLRA
jgi:hypothetical protein